MGSSELPLFSLFLGAAACVIGCNTGAVAIQECREIESLRCEVSVACGTVTDVEACQRFYQGHCLHGIAGPEAPSSEAQRRCLEAIRAAGSCAEADPHRDVEDCEDLPPALVEGARPLGDVCDAIGRPWSLDVCSYLNPAPDDKGEGGSKG